MTTSKPMLVYIVDSDPALRETVSTLLESVGLQVCALADLDAFLNAYQPRQPGCLLLDILIPGWGELSALQVLAEKGINLPVIVVTQQGNVATAVTVMKQGAMDFIEKPFNDQVLLDCVHNALAEDAVRRRARARRRIIQRRFETLTPREQEVLKQVAEGLSNRQIADSLNLSRKTVEVHRAKVMQKMEAETLSQLIRMAMLMGVLKTYDD